MKLKYEAFALAALLLLFGALCPVRAQVVPVEPPLEAGQGQHKTSIPGVIYETTTAQPAMQAINGGTITSEDNIISILLPGGIIGLEAEGTGSQITAKNPTILGLDTGQTGILAVTGVDGGLVNLEGGSIKIAGASSVGLLANNGTVDVSGPVTISMTGPDSYGVEAESGGVVDLSPGTTITTSGIGGFGILASAGGTVTANGISITTSGFLSPSGFDADGAATMGGIINLQNSSITTSGDNADGLHVFGGDGEITGTNLSIVTSGRMAAGAEADNGGSIQLSSTSISTTGDDAYGAVAKTGGLTDLKPGTVISTSGNGSYGLFATSGGNISGNGISVTTSGSLGLLLHTADGAAASTGSSGPGTIVLVNSTISANGFAANGLFVSGPGSSISIFNSNVVSSLGDGALVENGGNLTLAGSSLTALIHGIVTAGGTANTPNSILVSGGNVITVLGDALQVLNGATNITVNNGATVTGTTALLRVLDPPGGTVANLTASHASLVGDIVADPASQTTVNLTNGSTLTGRVNPLLSPGADLTIDGSSQWVITGSSNVQSLSVTPGATADFNTLFIARRTLTVEDLLGTGGRFGLNINLRRDVGDLIDITGISQGSHFLTFFDRGTDLRKNQSLLVVETADGVAGFSGMTDRGVFKYYVVHGNGSAITPDPNDWYLVRADNIAADQVERPPGLPAGSIGTPVGLSTVDALSNAANAAIGTYAAGTPLFYADMDTLIQRLGELRLLSEESRVSLDSGGKAVIPSAPPEELAPAIGTWINGFGNGMHITDEASRSFDQNTGGFQLGADVRLNAFHGDLYAGGFLSYFNASRDFLDGGNGSTNAFSLGTYATWLNPQGWYADLVLKYTQLWNYFNTPESDGSVTTAQYSIPALGGSLEVGRRFNLRQFFVEPEAQLAGVWESGNNYTPSNGLNVGGSDQYSLRGRVGVRAGMHFTLGNGMAFEPYLKVSALHEFLTGDQITLDDIPFFPTLSGTMVDAAAGLSARLNQSFLLYGEYDYANGDRIRQPWAVNLGVRWEWGGKKEEAAPEQPALSQYSGKQVEAKQVQLPPAKPAEPWEIKIGGPGWLASVTANIGTHGVTVPADVGVGQILRNINAIDTLSVEVDKGRFSLLGGYLYINAQASDPGEGLVAKTDISLQEFISQLAAGWRLIEGRHGWLDALGGFRFWYVGSQSSLQANQAAIDEASTNLVNLFAERLTTPNSNLRNLILQTLNLDALQGHSPSLPVPPLADREPDKIRNAVQALIQSQEPGLVAAIRTKAQAQITQLKTALASRIADYLTGVLSSSFSLYENWFDPFIGLRARYNLTKALYLTGEADIGGFGVGSEITWETYGALGCQITRNIYSEVGYRYLYLDYDTTSFIFQGAFHGAQITVGVNF
jgi:outer membrane autotransporter protein